QNLLCRHLRTKDNSMIHKSRFVNATLAALPLLLCVVSLVVPGCRKRPGYVTGLPGRANAIVTVNKSSGQAGRLPDLGSLASGNEELWVLARGEAAADSYEKVPGMGTLLAEVDKKEIPMPLKHTDVHASVSGYIGTVEVTQQF